MQVMKRLQDWLQGTINTDRYLYTNADLKALFPELSEGAFKTLLSRAVSNGLMERLCRGLYVYRLAMVSSGFILYHAAAHLRSNAFNYLSLETVLSEAGVISQMPVNCVSIMSSGRSQLLNCGKWGRIEFIHTRQTPGSLVEHLSYDERCHLWRADVSLALRDMRMTRKNMDLIDWSVASEFI